KPLELRGFLDQGTEIIGDLRFSDVLHFHGRFNGRVISDGELVVGESGVLEGDIEIGSLTLSGTIKGNIVARQRVHLLKTSRVIGDVCTPILRVDEGTNWEGSISTTTKSKSHEAVQKAENKVREDNKNIASLVDAKEVKKVG
ncbi:MAG: polymer-forming cytoskeletal protein, partial [bacterium]